MVVTTRNRREELRRALRSCREQVGVPFEVLVYDDASNDGTDSMVRAEFPEVRLFRRDVRAGLIVRRNESFRDARSDYVVSLDDDAFFTDSGTLRRIVELFEIWPQAAALAMPFVEPHASPSASFMPPLLGGGATMRNYIGCSHAIRRQVALDLGGYPELLVHQGEERDLCIRLLENGWDIRFADTPPLVHYYSLKREPARINYYGYRNTILFYWMRGPFPECLWAACKGTVALFLHKFTLASVPTRVYALSVGWLGAIRFWKARQPVSRSTWRRFYSLPSHGPLALTESERQEHTHMAEVTSSDSPAAL